MPKRTTEFQKLIYLLKKHKAAGAKVTESKLLCDQIGRECEVDVCIEQVVIGHHVIIAIECTEQTRPADVGWVNEMLGKHDGLPTTLVLASKSGFTPAAVAKAKMEHIELISLDKVDANSTKRLVGGSSSLWFKSFHLHPTKVVLHVPASDGFAEENVIVSPIHEVYHRDGRFAGYVRDLVAAAMHAEDNVRKLTQPGRTSHKAFQLVLDQYREPDGNPYCLQKLDTLVLRPFTSVRIVGKCNFDISQFVLNHGKLQDVEFAWGTSTFQGKQTLLVASPDDQGGQKLSLTPLPASKKKAARAAKQKAARQPPKDGPPESPKTSVRMRSRKKSK